MPQAIKAIDPTIFLAESNGALRRLVKVTLELDAAANCTLIARGPGIDQHIDLGRVGLGHPGRRPELVGPLLLTNGVGGRPERPTSGLPRSTFRPDALPQGLRVLALLFRA